MEKRYSKIRFGWKRIPMTSNIDDKLSLSLISDYRSRGSRFTRSQLGQFCQWGLVCTCTRRRICQTRFRPGFMCLGQIAPICKNKPKERLVLLMTEWTPYRQRWSSRGTSSKTPWRSNQPCNSCRTIKCSVIYAMGSWSHTKNGWTKLGTSTETNNCAIISIIPYLHWLLLENCCYMFSICWACICCSSASCSAASWV